MKVLCIILLVVLTIVLSVVASVYVIELRSNLMPNNRYQLIFNTVRHTTSKPVPDEPGISTTTPSDKPICFKFDTATGKTWRYVSDFYKDANEFTTTCGFERLLANDEFPFRISRTHIIRRKTEEKEDSTHTRFDTDIFKVYSDKFKAYLEKHRFDVNKAEAYLEKQRQARLRA